MVMGWTGRDVRQRFLDYFEEKGHKVCSSYPLVPPNDPSLMFTNAGMVQFKDVFTGKEKKAFARAASAQKCVRISGKHNDLENVGRTSRHHTFFEMLGNFSFGDYFKREACQFAWELITEGYGLDKDRLRVSVHESDTEAFAIWVDEVGVDKERIFELGDKDNFWAMGDTGPCGPCSEILYDRGDAFGVADPDNGERFFEIWNLVFMQYQVDVKGGPRHPLPAPSIDTGAGLERITSVLQGVNTNYDTDFFLPLLDLAGDISGKKYRADEQDDISLRVIADHARMTAFCVAEGLRPANKDRPYVLRRVMRRAIRHGHRLGIETPFLHKVALGVVELMGRDYPELVEARHKIEEITHAEEVLFRKTLDKGLKKLHENSRWLDVEGQRLIPGDVAYDLYQQDGFPKDLIEVIGEEEGFGLDEDGWREAKEKHKIRSKGDTVFADEIDPVFFDVKEEVGATEFVGYEREKARSEIAALIQVTSGGEPGSKQQQLSLGDRHRVEEAHEGELVEIISYVTPCYGEAGGQVGDRGTIVAPQGHAEIIDTQRQLSLIVHVARIKGGTIRLGDSVDIEADHLRRAAIRRSHSATHLLHWGLRSVLGSQATQRGSVVAPELLRFDFDHDEPLTEEQLRSVEDLANEKVLSNVPVETEQTTLTEARQLGAMSLFGEKYDERVRMVRISADSLELCGGTHASRSGDIGMIKITRQESVGAGVRRIYAVTGIGGLDYVRRLEKNLDLVGKSVKEADRGLVVERVERLDHDRRNLVKEVEDLRRQLATGGGDDLLTGVKEIGGVKVLGRRLPVGDSKAMMEAADTVRDRLGSGVALLGAENNGKAALVMIVTKDLVPRLDAVQLIRQVAPSVGAKGGGGRADLARTGGPELDGLDKALSEILRPRGEGREGAAEWLSAERAKDISSGSGSVFNTQTSRPLLKSTPRTSVAEGSSSRPVSLRSRIRRFVSSSSSPTMSRP